MGIFKSYDTLKLTPSKLNCGNSTCYLFDFFAQWQSPVNTESREPIQIENLWVYSKVMTL